MSFQTYASRRGSTVLSFIPLKIKHLLALVLALLASIFFILPAAKRMTRTDARNGAPLEAIKRTGRANETDPATQGRIREAYGQLPPVLRPTRDNLSRR